ncbi:HAMP domain-containing sensor histidine kinase [Paucibacter sp. APW11]|uniref:histidine kinase n=1 Tax=Roseateles aquae TaxID=3077235 RepID=A0ABU3PCR8_9BURK|nr:HAMP domain-containing sensor histidine kinase [Paucibacter sp. APW11]MDT9000371.1 HAMP domain-containing sensor histidine kinase [Paucibacter sp. APW11]
MSSPHGPGEPGTAGAPQQGTAAPAAVSAAPSTPGAGVSPDFKRLLDQLRRLVLLRRFSDAWQMLAQCQEAMRASPDPDGEAGLCCQALGLRLRALSVPEVPADCIAEAQRLDALSDAGIGAEAQIEVALTLGEVFGQIGLIEPALNAFERARHWLASRPDDSQALAEVDLGLSSVLLRSGLYHEVIERLQPWVHRELAPELRQQLGSLLGSAYYFLAEAGGPDSAAHRDASLHFHAMSARETEHLGGPFGHYRCAVNLAIGHARRGDIQIAAQQLQKMEDLRDEVWPQVPGQPATRPWQEHQSWVDYVRALIALAEGRRDDAIGLMQSILAHFRDASPTSFMGLLLLRAAELLVSTAQEAGNYELAFHALRDLQGMQERRHRGRAELSSRLLADALAATKLRIQNSSLQQHGDVLQQTLAQRHQELTVTLDQLRTEVAIRQATEAALQQAHDELEQRVQERTDDLHRTLQALAHQERLAAMAHMVVGIGHELNTPLGNALLALSTQADATADLTRHLSEGQLKRSELLEFLALLGNSSELARHSLQRAADLVQRFKELSVQQVPEPRLRFNPTHQVEQALQRWRIASGAQQVRLESHIEHCGSADSYPGALVRILDQLIDNALSHAFEPGDGSDAQIHVSLALEGDQIELRVRDNGRGVQSHQREEIFSPFMTSARSRGHTGLGLHVAHLLAQQMLGGQLRAEGSWPQGLVMVLRFPRRAPAREPAPLSPAPTPATSPSPTP